MYFIFFIRKLGIKLILPALTVLEKFCCNLTEQSVAQNVLVLLDIFAYLASEFIKLVRNVISRSAGDSFFIAENFLCKFGLDFNRSFSVFAPYKSAEFLGNILVPFTENNVEHCLRSWLDGVTSGG